MQFKVRAQAIVEPRRERLAGRTKVGLRHNERVYILDGHVRMLFAKRKRKRTIQAIILVPSKPVDYGVVKAAERMGLRSLDDIRILP